MANLHRAHHEVMLAGVIVLLQVLGGLRGHFEDGKQKDLQGGSSSVESQVYPEYISVAYHALSPEDLGGAGAPAASYVTPRVANYAKAAGIPGRIELYFHGDVKLTRDISLVELALRLRTDYPPPTTRCEMGDWERGRAHVCDLDLDLCESTPGQRRHVALGDVNGTWAVFNVSLFSIVTKTQLRLQVDIVRLRQAESCFHLNSSEAPVLAIWQLPPEAPTPDCMFKKAQQPQLPTTQLPESRQSDEGTAQTACRRVPWIVDFRKLGWHWVIYPTSYSAYACAGSCSDCLEETAHTNHAVLRSELIRRHPKRSSVAGPHCAPITMAKLEVLYILDDYLNKSTLEEMIVMECGCL